MPPVRKHVHAERLCDFRHVAADIPKADDADRFPRKLHMRDRGHLPVVRPEPAMRFDVMVKHGGVAGDLQQQRRRHLRHGVGAVCGHVAHYDATLLCCRDVDHVKARRERVDEPQVGAGVHHRRADVAAVDKYHFRVADVGGNFIRLRGLIQRKFALLCNGFPGDIPGVDEESVQNCDLHPCFSVCVFGYCIIFHFRCRASSANASVFRGDSSPTRIRIEAGLPLPAGEVAVPPGIGGEGVCNVRNPTIWPL